MAPEQVLDLAPAPPAVFGYEEGMRRAVGDVLHHGNERTDPVKDGSKLQKFAEHANLHNQMLERMF